MTKFKAAISLVFVVAILLVTGGVGAFSSEEQLHKIVVFKQGVDEQAAATAVGKSGGLLKKYLGLINGAAVILPSKAAEMALKERPEVLRIDEDIRISVSKPVKPQPQPDPVPLQPKQEIPWGIDRIDADLALAVTQGGNVRVAVIDTGVDINHPDLNANVKGGVNTISRNKSYQDDNGHGTHVAGIIGAVNNTIGVVGAAPRVEIYAVKALDRTGNGWLSDIIEGLDWAVRNDMQVVNMSLGTSYDVQALHDAVIKAYNAGIIMVASAGNEGPGSNTVSYPGAYPQAIAVAAVDQNNQIADFSSRGSQVDIAAPGVKIISTWYNDYYAELDGTSMASPHVAGTAALVISVKGAMSPDAMKLHLKYTAENLGLPAEQQGAGLVDALAAIQ